MSWRLPFNIARQSSSPEIETSFVRHQLSVAGVKRLVTNEQANDLAISDIDNHLSGLGIAVSPLGVGKRDLLVKGVQIRTQESVGFALVKIGPPTDMSIGQRKNGLRVRESIKVETDFPDGPRLQSKSL